MAAAPSANAPRPPPTPHTGPPRGRPRQVTPASVVPFLRGSGRGKYKFYSKAGLTLTTATQDLGPIDIKAYDYMRSILVTVTGTSAGTATAGTYAADCAVQRDHQRGGEAAQRPDDVPGQLRAARRDIQKYGFYRANTDPREDPSYTMTTSTTAPNFTFAFRIPFELDLRDALGALPNKDAAAPFTLELTLNTLANVLPVSTTSPTLTVEAWLEAYDQPPQTLNGQPVQTTPPNMNTLQRWTEQNITMATGQFDARVRKLGNYLRELIFISKNSSSARIVTNGWADPVQIVLDEDVKDNLARWTGSGRSGRPGATAALCPPARPHCPPPSRNDTAQGADTGVWPIQYFLDTAPRTRTPTCIFPTIESEDYLLSAARGARRSTSWWPSCMRCFRKAIFSDYSARVLFSGSTLRV